MPAHTIHVRKDVMKTSGSWRCLALRDVVLWRSQPLSSFSALLCSVRLFRVLLFPKAWLIPLSLMFSLHWKPLWELASLWIWSFVHFVFCVLYWAVGPSRVETTYCWLLFLGQVWFSGLQAAVGKALQVWALKNFCSRQRLREDFKTRRVDRN